MKDFMSESILKELNFEPKFVHHSCENCDHDYKIKNCLNDGKYCAVLHSDTTIDGRDIVMENLRENCLYQKLELKNQQSKFFDYIFHIHELCGTRLSFKCYVTSMKAIDFPQEYVDTCVEESFTEKDHSKGDNTMLKNMME